LILGSKGGKRRRLIKFLKNPFKNLDALGHYFLDFTVSQFVAPFAFEATRSYLKSIKK